MLEKLQQFKEIISVSDYIFSSNETVDEISLSFTYDRNFQEVNFISHLIDLFNLSPDIIKIKSTNTLPPLSFSNNSLELKDNLLQHLNKHIKLKTKCIVYIVMIPKIALLKSNNFQNFTWFLNIESFINILNDPIKNISILSSIFNYYKSNIVLFINTNNIYLKNSISLISSIEQCHHNDIINFNSTNSNLSNKIDIRKNCCNIEFQILDIVPDYFIFDFNNSLFQVPLNLKILLNNLFVLFFILYISNYSSLSDNNINIKISSTKIIEFDYDINSLNTELRNYNFLIQLYYSAYNSLTLENLYLVRNMILLHIPENSNLDKLTMLVSKSDVILESAKENLNILSIQNVEKYFSIRYNLYDFLDKSTAYIQTQITELVEKLNKTFLSTIATLIGVSFVYLKDRNLLVLRFSLLIYILYLIIDFIFSFTSIKKSYNTYNKKYLDKLNYFRPIIGDEHYNKILADDAITNNLKIRFNYYFYIVLGIYIIMIFLGSICFFYTTDIIDFIKNYIL